MRKNKSSKIVPLFLIIALLLCSFTVKSYALSNNTIKISSSNVVLSNKGMTEYIEVEQVILNELVKVNDNVEWSSSNINIVTVKDGFIKAKGAGNAVVTLSIKGISRYINVTVLSSQYPKVITDYLKIAASSTTTSKYSRNTVEANCYDMYSYQWTPTQNLTGYNSYTTYYANTQYTGVPYSQTTNQTDDSGSLPSGLTGYYQNGFNYALVNSASTNFYVNTTNWQNKTQPRYGNDCSGFASLVIGINRYNTTGLIGLIDEDDGLNMVGSYNVDNPTYSDLLSSYSSMARGDVIVKSGHAMVIADVYSTYCVVYEQDVPAVQTNLYYYTSLASSGYRPCNNF